MGFDVRNVGASPFYYLCTHETRSFSSAGLERLLDRQEVSSSNLLSFTKKPTQKRRFFLLYQQVFNLDLGDVVDSVGGAVVAEV